MVAPVTGGHFRIGTEAGLLFAGCWQDVEPRGSGVDRTRGLLTVMLEGLPIWGGGRVESDSAIEWTWIELLEGLAESWPFLRWQEVYPEHLRPRHPGEVETRLAELRETKPAALREAIEEETYDWLERHDMSRWLHGLSARPLRVLRQGRLAVVVGGSRIAWLPMDDVLAVLADVGDAIQRRLDGAEDARSVAAVAAWRSRDLRRPVELASIYAGLPEAEIERLPFSVSADVGFEPDEILAAARMAPRSLGRRGLRTVVRRIRKLRRTANPELDALSSRACRVRDEMRQEIPYEQGYRLAEELRPYLPGGSRCDRLDIHRVMRALGVAVETIRLPADAESVDAVAVWGPRHGPAVLLNERGLHARSAVGSRATLAHELCHLLVDRDGALPLADVLGGRAAVLVERRANAFAAELLLPKLAVTDRPGAGPLIIDDCRRLFRRYHVSRQLGAWQILNSPVDLPVRARHQLEIWSRGFGGDVSGPS